MRARIANGWPHDPHATTTWMCDFSRTACASLSLSSLPQKRQCVEVGFPSAASSTCPLYAGSGRRPAAMDPGCPRRSHDENMMVARVPVIALLVFAVSVLPVRAERPIVDLHRLDAYFALFAGDSNVPWKAATVRLDTYSSAPVQFSGLPSRSGRRPDRRFERAPARDLHARTPAGGCLHLHASRRLSVPIQRNRRAARFARGVLRRRSATRQTSASRSGSIARASG